MTDTDHTTHRRTSVLGATCARCGRYLVDSSTARKGLTGRWRHESCSSAPRPTESDFVALAGTLMETHPWPRLRQLRAELGEVLDELDQGPVARVPAQAGPPAAETVRTEEQEEAELRKRLFSLQTAIDDERAWKASRLALEWGDLR